MTDIVNYMSRWSEARRYQKEMALERKYHSTRIKSADTREAYDFYRWAIAPLVDLSVGYVKTFGKKEEAGRLSFF